MQKRFRTGLLISCCLFVLLSLAAGPLDAGLKQKLAVFPFIAKNMEAMTLTESLSSLLLNSIDRAGYFEILERKKIENIIELEGLRLESLSKEDILKIGARNNIDFLLCGTATRVGRTVAIEIQLFSVRENKVCAGDTIRTSEGELATNLYNTAQDIVKSAQKCLSPDSMAMPVQRPLTVPENIKISGTSKSIRINWTHQDMSNLIGFKIFRSNNADGPFTQIATTIENFYIDENLKLNETFYYRVKAIDKKGTDSEFSLSVVGKTSIAPQPPIFLNIQDNVKGAYLQWRSRPQSGKESDNVEAGYKVFRKVQTEKEFKEVAVVPADNTTYTDHGLKDNTAYTYTLTAFNALNTESDFSAILEVTTPHGVSGLKVESGKIRRVPLKWDVNVNDVVEGYRVYRAQGENDEYKKIAQTPDRHSISYMDTGLEDNKTYWYRVTACNKNNIETDMSEPVSATTRPKPPVPAGLAAKSGEARKVSLKWEAIKSPEDEIRGYKIYRAAEEKGEYNKAAEVDAGKDQFSDNNTPLKDNTVYYYRISSYNSAGAESQQTESVSATTKALPQIPGGLKAVSGDVKKVSLSWDKNPEQDIKEYVIYRKTKDEKDFDRIKSTKEASYADSRLRDGVEYEFAVQAVDSDNLFSPVSSPVAAKTKPLPQKPSGLKIADQDGKKRISWDANPEKDIKKYNVYKKGFLGISQKVGSVQDNYWETGELRGKTELFVTAQDETDLEGEASETITVPETK